MSELPAIKTELGMDVVSPDTRIPDGAVRYAANVELNDKSGFRRRPGFSYRTEGPNAGLWQPDNMALALYVNSVSQKLMGIHAGEDDLELADGATELWAVEHAHWVYAAIGSRVVRIDPDFSCRNTGIASFIGIRPTLTAVNGGFLPLGKYLVAVSYNNDLGEESGLTDTATITLGATFGAIRVNLPPAPTDAVTMNIYRSYPNGEKLYRVVTVASDTSYEISSNDALGRPAQTWLKMPLPSGMLASYQGRVYSARGSFLFFTDAMMPNLCDARTGYIPFGETITVVVPVANGMFVGTTSQVFFLWGGGPTEFQIRVVAANPAIFGSGQPLPASLFNEELLRGAVRLPGGAEAEVVAAWLSPLGIQLGLVGGAVLTQQEGRIALACRSARLIGFKRRGIHQLLCATRGLTFSVGGAAS